MTASDTAAFCHSINSVTRRTVGEKWSGMSSRATLGCTNYVDSWMITHPRVSVPFDMTCGKASLALKPQVGLKRDGIPSRNASA